MSVQWSEVIAAQKHWTEQVCRYLDDWSPEPRDMPARRAAAFDTVTRHLQDYLDEHGRSVRTLFRLALCQDIHRRFVRIHGVDGGDDPMRFYSACKGLPALSSTLWGGVPLVTELDRCIVDLSADSAQPDPDPDVMTAAGTTDLPVVVALADRRRRLVKLLESDDDP